MAAATPVFQSAPPRRGRPDLGHMMPGVASFNPRPREGGDGRGGFVARRNDRFNPRPREGGDQRAAAPARPRKCFNPRPREGGDVQYHGKRPFRQSFNPRPREGGDVWLFGILTTTALVSIRAPAKGATSPISTGHAREDVSIRAPAKGATNEGIGRRARAEVSIRAPAKGATHRPRPLGHESNGFNPRPREGGDTRKPITAVQ